MVDEVVQSIAPVGMILDGQGTNVNNINILEAKPLDGNNTISAKPHIPSVSASAVHFLDDGGNPIFELAVVFIRYKKVANPIDSF